VGLGNFSEFHRLSSTPITLDLSWRDNRLLARFFSFETVKQAGFVCWLIEERKKIQVNQLTVVPFLVQYSYE
jgi:hypothetical protein